MKKVYLQLCSIFIALLLIISISACNITGTDVDKSIRNTSVENEISEDGYEKYAPIPGKQYTITWTSQQSAPLGDNPEILDYWNEKLDVNIVIWNIENTRYAEILNLKVASGEIPDEMLITSFVNFQKLHDQEMLAKLPEPVIKKYAPDLVKHIENDSLGAFKYAKIDGEIHAIPFIGYNDKFRAAVVWRADWLENVGIKKVPETIDEFEEAFYKFAKEDPDKNNENDTFGLSESAFSAIFGAYGYIPSYCSPIHQGKPMWQLREGKMVFSSVQPEVKEALRKLNKWYMDGVLDPEFITGENKGGPVNITHAFANGRIGYTSHGFYYNWAEENEEVSRNLDELFKSNKDAKLAYGLPPIGPEGIRGVYKRNAILGSFRAIGKHVESEPDKIGKILEVMNALNGTYESWLTCRLGFEGKQWELVDGKVKAIGKYVDPKEVAKLGGHTVLQLLAPFEFMSKYLTKSTAWAIRNQYDKYGIHTELCGALPSEGKYLTELDKIEREAFIAIITGDKPIDYFDEFVEKWKKSGGEQLEKEANEWYEIINQQ